jgi:hypothetical protein
MEKETTPPTYNVNLTPSQLIDLIHIVGDELDNIQYLLQQEITDGDPNEEVESLTDQVLETRDLLILLEKTLNPTALDLGNGMVTHGSVVLTAQ